MRYGSRKTRCHQPTGVSRYREKGIQIESITDTSQELIKAKNDPMLQGTNGALTLGFVVTMSVSTIGF